MEEVGKMSNNMNPMKDEKDEDDVPLPGFRFHPTDEELVGFYLRRKVEKKPISIELIKQVDIYKYDPWDLPKASNVGDKEWYFFCKRGRKYRNSIRPNRVTGSGFWKATGIDRPIYSSGGAGGGRECIGLKKSLVYYRGSAGKGTKTDWMMHEFRLPTDHDNKSTKHVDVKSIAQEAEVWTLCRILKRSASYRKCLPDWKELTTAVAHHNNNANNKRKLAADASSRTCSLESTPYTNSASYEAGYIDFRANVHQVTRQYNDPQNKQLPISSYGGTPGGGCAAGYKNTTAQTATSSLTTRQIHQDVLASTTAALNPNSCFGPEMNELIKCGDWDELRSLVEFAYEPFV